MKAKVRPSEQMSNKIESILSNELASDNLVGELLRLGAQQILQRAAEGEADEFLGRGWYSRNEEEAPHRGYRNGYSDFKVKTAVGALNIERPRIRDNEETFESALFRRIDHVESNLVKLATEMYVRGLSTRDIEKSLVDEQGKPLLSRSVTSRLSDELFEEYERWNKQDLSSYDVIYLFVDGVYESVRKYTNNQTILCGWGICSDGRKVLLGLGAVSSESAESWEHFFKDLKDRGLSHPLLVASDGGKGVVKAISKCFPLADRSRCIAHKMRNLMNKLPKDREITDPIKARLHAIYYASDLASAQGLAERFITDYAEKFPAMVACFNDDLEACLVHLKYPIGHRRSIRTTNLIERSFVEQKRRTKVIPAHQNEKGALKLVFGVMIRSAVNWQRVNMSETDLILLKTLRQTMTKPYSISLTDERISFKYAA